MKWLFFFELKARVAEICVTKHNFKSKQLFMYVILDKDMIEKSIVAHLPSASRGFAPTVPLDEIVNAILYKLKSVFIGVYYL